MKRSLVFAGLLSLLTLSGFAQTGTAPAPAPAATESKAAQWREAHPRRAEVNARLANQHRRIKDEVAEGEMSKAKAARLQREDRRIRQEERLMAAQNGGHITRQEQRTLNQQENAVSRQIGK